MIEDNELRRLRYRDRRRGCLVALGLLALYGCVDVVRSAGPTAYAARGVWILALGGSALFLRSGRPRFADHSARLVGLVSGVCATVLVHAYGPTDGIYFGFLLCLPFCVLVIVPDLPSSAALSGVATTVGGIVLLAGEGRGIVTIVEWTALAAMLNLLAGFATQLYHRARKREEAAVRERAQAVSDLRASEQRFQTAFSSTSLGALIVTLDGRILTANAAIAEKLGYADLAGRDYFELLVTGDVADARRVFAETAKGVHSPRIERRLRTASGDVLLASVHASPVCDGDAEVTTAVIVLEDITERRLLRERLSKSERLAALGTLAAGVAHEINNPLAYVKGNLCWTREAISDGDVDRGELCRVLEETERGAERIARIVAELSAYARVREEPSATHVPRVLEDTLRMVSKRIGSACELTVLVAPDLPRVSAVGRHLSQALVNLLVNAVEAIENRAAREAAAPRRVQVRAARDGRFVSIAVEDSGDGLREEALAHLFEPFFTTKGPLGTGLGLAISRENLTRFGATIEGGRSALGGARFVVRIPCVPGGEAALAAARPAA